MLASDLSLAPLRDALLASARADADALCADATARAELEVAAARRESDELVARARLDAERRADHEARRREAEQRRAARARVLVARRTAYDALRDAATRAVLQRRSEDDYAALLDRLEADARTRLGPLAVIERDPADVGGVRARAGGRLIDSTLPALVERGLVELGPEIETLWE